MAGKPSERLVGSGLFFIEGIDIQTFTIIVHEKTNRALYEPKRTDRAVLRDCFEFDDGTS